jgi:gas vesicle protein
MKSIKLVIAVLTSVATGLVLGILFAPSKGSKTRKQLLDKGENYADALKDEFGNLLDVATQKYEHTRKEAKDLIAKAKTKQEEIKETNLKD